MNYYNTNFITQPSQPSQPIRLSHPTQYHLQQTKLRNQNTFASDAIPPTPDNSFNNTIDPNLLVPQQSISSQVKHESGQLEMLSEDYPVSPTNTTPTFGSPQGIGAFDNEDFGRSYKPAGPLSGSPITYPQNVEYFDTEFSPTSAPSTTAIPMDVKPNRNNHNNHNTKFYRQSHGNNLNQISMSLPVQLPTDWPFGTSLEQASSFQPGSLQFPPGADVQMMTNLMDDDTDATQKQLLLVEKRRRRRESHNAVERRRRDNINEKIQELSTLLPEMYIDSTNKPNKGVILRKSVEYIRFLKQTVEDERSKSLALEARLRASEVGSGGGGGVNSSTTSNTNNVSPTLSNSNNNGLGGTP